MTDIAPVHAAARLSRDIESRNHARHSAQLSTLIKLAAMVEDLHCDDDGVPKGLADLLAGMVREIETHMKKEDLNLFPAIRRSDDRGIGKPIAAIRADHVDHDREIHAIRRLTRNLSVPEDACSSWRTLYSDLRAFIDDLTEHVRPETEARFRHGEPRGHADV